MSAKFFLGPGTGWIYCPFNTKFATLKEIEEVSFRILGEFPTWGNLICLLLCAT